MSDRVAAMMAEIEAKQREVKRIIAEETKKNVVPPLIEVLEEEIEDSIETKRLLDARMAYHDVAINPGAGLRKDAAYHREVAKGTVYGIGPQSPESAAYHLRKAESLEADAAWHEQCGKIADKTESRAPCLLLRAQLDAAKKDAEWKIQSFKLIDALTQRVAALEARLDAKETVPLGTPVLGSDPDSGEDSVEDTCEGSSSHETTRRTLFPYW